MSYGQIQKKEVLKQSKFCGELLDHINTDLEQNLKETSDGSCCVFKYTTIQNDIVKLRRELLRLRDMIDWRNN